VEDKRTQLEQQLKEKDEALLRALSDLAEAALNLERKTDEVRQLQSKTCRKNKRIFFQRSYDLCSCDV